MAWRSSGKEFPGHCLGGATGLGHRPPFLADTWWKKRPNALNVPHHHGKLFQEGVEGHSEETRVFGSPSAESEG